MAISPDRILYEDDHFLAVNKRSGELVVKGSGKVEKLPLFDFLKKDCTGLKVLHRLDFETSGVVLFAKNKEAYEGVRGLGVGGWKKRYGALVVGRIPQRNGVINKKLAARGRSRRQGYGRQEGNVEAQTRYRVLRQWRDVSFVEAEIETGRHHQIRKHFAYIGHPLVLDHVYGDERFNKKFAQVFRLRKFLLHAYAVEFVHPVTQKKIKITAPLPKTFEAVLDAL